MAATVLTSPRATEMSVYVVRAFVRMREILASHAELSQKLWELEQRLDRHDEEIMAIITALGQFLAPPDVPDRKMGYRLKEEQELYTVNRMD